MAKRLQKEFKQYGSDDLSWCKVEMVGDSLYEWRAKFEGPENTPYEKGTFEVSIKIPQEYPFKAPNFTFVTKVYHPNINKEDGDGWSPEIQIKQVIIAIKTIMAEPNPGNPTEPEIAEQFTSDNAAYVKTATEWTKKYAK